MDTSGVALVTGGSSGIGYACVKKFLQIGWKVSVLALPGPEMDTLASLGVVATPGDIALGEVREECLHRTLYQYGRVDVLINSAGVGLYAPPTQVSIPLFSRLIDVNVIAPLALAQLVIPEMKKQGKGAIVNMGSVAGLVSLPWSAAYSASKFALNALDDSLRLELRRSPIQVLKVCPGIVATDFRKHVLTGSAPAQVERLRWVVSPETIADRILWALERRRRTVYVPRIGRLFAVAGAIAPPLMDFYLSRFFAGGTPLDAIADKAVNGELLAPACLSPTADEDSTPA